MKRPALGRAVSSAVCISPATRDRNDQLPNGVMKGPGLLHSPRAPD
jgi:hypothetical protein